MDMDMDMYMDMDMDMDMDNDMYHDSILYHIKEKENYHRKTNSVSLYKKKV